MFHRSRVRPRGRAILRCAVGAAGLFFAAACSKDELNELVEKGKQQVEQGVEKAKQAASDASQQVAQKASDAGEQAKQKLSLAGSMQLTLDAPVQTAGCYVKLIPPLAGRSGILQIRSYHQPDSETFPSALLQIPTTAANVEALRDQTLAGQMFVQREASGAVWESDAASPVQIKITQADSNTFTAEITGGTLRKFPDGTSHAVTGKLTGAWH